MIEPTHLIHITGDVRFIFRVKYVAIYLVVMYMAS